MLEYDSKHWKCLDIQQDLILHRRARYVNGRDFYFFINKAYLITIQ